ncbi:NAD-dependent epimerase/dehydratase family protein [candidate division KSB1 bacterium]|nr:NAD-dependent epimerase/dehydratase family protein [candidate division KSB1 bacterium]
MNKKVFVTGGTGFTGGRLCEILCERGYHVKALARQTSKLENLRRIGAEIIYGDISDKASMKPAMKGVDCVYHIAAAFREENVPHKHFYDVNVDGTRNVLEAAFETGLPHFVHCSTVGVQGEIADPPATEDAPYNPGDVYQESKMQGELMVKDFYQQNQYPGAIFRPVGIYGPGDTRFLKIFKWIYSGKFRMIGSGKVLYHWTYIDDLVDGIILCGEKKEAAYGLFTLGGEEFVTLNEIVALIADALQVSVKKGHIPVFPVWLAGALCELVCRPLGIQPPIYRRRVDFFMKDRAFDISKAKRVLGYQPRVSLKEGIRRTAKWYLEKGLLK